MTNSSTRLIGAGVLLVLAACGGGTVSAQGVKGRPIEFSEPPSERGKTAESKLVPGQTRLGQWESELNRPFEHFTPGKTLDGMILSTPLPLPPPAVPGPRVRESNDWKKDWMFRSAEELFGIKTVEDKYKAPELTPDGRNRDDLRPMVRAYYDAAESANSPAVSNQYAQPLLTSPLGGGGGGLGSMLPGVNARSSLPPQASPLESELRRALPWGSPTGNPAATDAADFFKFNSGYKVPSKPTAAELQRADDFRQILDFSNTQPDLNAPKADHIFSSPYVDQSFFDPPKPQIPAPAATLGGGLGNGGTGAGSLPSWSSIQPPPAAERARNTPAHSSPFLTIPRRQF